MLCFLISEILKDEKYITSSALNSDDAIKKFKENKPDLIILDVWLSNSKLDGIGLLQEFKSLDNKIPINVILAKKKVLGVDTWEDYIELKYLCISI